MRLHFQRDVGIGMKKGADVDPIRRQQIEKIAGVIVRGGGGEAIVHPENSSSPQIGVKALHRMRDPTLGVLQERRFIGDDHELKPSSDEDLQRSNNLFLLL